MSVYIGDLKIAYCWRPGSRIRIDALCHMTGDRTDVKEMADRLGLHSGYRHAGYCELDEINRKRAVCLGATRTTPDVSHIQREILR